MPEVLALDARTTAALEAIVARSDAPDPDRLVALDALAKERFGRMFPDPGARTDPQAWDRFEAAYPETFRGMIQFWCCKDD